MASTPLTGTGQTDDARRYQEVRDPARVEGDDRVGEVNAGKRATQLRDVDPDPAALRTTGQIALPEAVPTTHIIGTWKKLPNDSDAVRDLNRGFEFDKAGDPKKALELYARALPALEEAGDPERLKVYFNRSGLALKHLGENKKAREMLLEALTYDAAYAPAFYNLACLSLQEGSTAESVSWLKKAIGVDAQFFKDLAKNDPDLNSLRQNPEFRALVGLPELPRAKE